jgi:hypothetical protein
MIIKLVKHYENGTRHTLYVAFDRPERIEREKARIDREDVECGDGIRGLWSVTVERQ